MKIYTKTGDKGETSLANGKRISKSNLQVDLYGLCDELNSSIGVAYSFLGQNSQLSQNLSIVQNTLLDLGSVLAGFNDQKNTISITASNISFLEQSIDSMQTNLPELKNFILPAGSKPAAFLHVSRTICRRLERKLILAKETKELIFPNAIEFINRLSDFLFVAARFANFEEGFEDVKWAPRK